MLACHVLHVNVYHTGKETQIEMFNFQLSFFSGNPRKCQECKRVKVRVCLKFLLGDVSLLLHLIKV